MRQPSHVGPETVRRSAHGGNSRRDKAAMLDNRSSAGFHPGFNRSLNRDRAACSRWQKRSVTLPAGLAEL